MRPISSELDVWKWLWALWIISLIIAAAPVFGETTEPATATENAASPLTLFRLSYGEAEDAIGKALAAKGAGKLVAATLTDRKPDALFSYNKPCSIEIRGLQFDKDTSRWNASLLLISEGQVVTARPASGRFEEIISATVLKRQMRKGEVISADDITTRTFPLAQTRSDTITDAANLIGKSPARVISAFRPVMAHELAQPTMVKKNTLVQMRYRSPGMEITAAGQAMSDGAQGDVIDVRNASSKKIVRAVIQDEHTVDILGATQTSQLETGNAAN